MIIAEDGKQVALRPRSFEVLSVLVERAGTVVTKEEIFDAVWPGISVTEDSLVQCISDIRHALDDGEHRIVKTVPRRGYTIILDNKVHKESGVLRPVVCVQRFECLDDGLGRHLAAGLTIDLIANLSRYQHIMVVAHRTSHGVVKDCMPFEQTHEPVGNRYVLTGHLQACPSKIRLTVLLSDEFTGAFLWRDRFEKPIGELFDLQDELTAAIVNRLTCSAGVLYKVEFDKVRRKPLSAMRAYEFYVLGTNVDEIFSPDGVELAMQSLLKSVEIDAYFARAWHSLAILQLIRSAFGYAGDPEVAIRECILASKKAVLLSPDDPMVQASAAVACFMEGDRAKGIRAYDRALALGANDADTLATIAYTRPTKLPTAQEDAEWARRAMVLNPYYPDWYLLAAGYSSFYAGAYAEAIRVLEAVKITASDRHLFLALCHAALGNPEEASRHREILLGFAPNFSIKNILIGDTIIDEDAVQRFTENAEKARLPS